MRAIWYDRTGPAREVLVVGMLPTPMPARGEVRVRLHASGVNPSDCNRRFGKGYEMEFPRVVPNSDGSGVVDLLGEGVDTSLLGQRVWLYNGQRGRAFGTAAEFIALDAGLVAPLPATISFEQGACLGIPCMTAYHCVFMDGAVEGKTLLVQGGAGAVGHFAVQLATWGGARVIATVDSETKAHHAREGGATDAIDFAREDVVDRVLALTGGEGVDRVIEVDFGANLGIDLRVLRANGAIASYASRGQPAPSVPFYELMRKNITVHTVFLPGTLVASRKAAQYGVGRWLDSSHPRIAISQIFALDSTADAHEAVEGRTKLGTVVVRCS